MDPVQEYLKEIREIRSTGAGVPETSYYPALSNLLNEVGKTLKPKVRCVMQLRNRGAGNPDGGLFTPDQLQQVSDTDPLTGQIPACGVIEIKPISDDTWVTAGSTQVTKYWKRYGLVLVTNYRDFLVIGKDDEGKPKKFESFRLAGSEKEFWDLAGHPSRARSGVASRFIEFLKRVMRLSGPLTNPEDVAWFLASYARDAKARIEASNLPALAAVREALEGALGLKFEGERGDHFFRSTLIQTLFYGVFSAWVLWSHERPQPARPERFDWKQTAWSLRVPMIRALFEQVAAPTKLEPLGLVEPLDWTANALNRVDRSAFFATFDQGHAVQYFYEPFLEQFDPELRKQYGVWYTPPEVVKYMVARVDTVLREGLEIPDGLADPRVYVLDPCCGTGAYLVEVLERIGATIRENGGDALAGQDVKRAAMERVFGFEIMPAPFVIAHLQLGLLLSRLNAPLADQSAERASVYLTNALTGWEPPKGPKQHLIFPELEQERDAAAQIKRDKPILVILGNPPYNGVAGVAVAEERGLSDAYRTAKKAAAPQGQGLNDLYVRFYSMAERRIATKTGKGVVCLISNYSWLEGLSFTGMRERYLEAFDRIWIDCLNGDRYKTGKLTPDGQPDPSIFSTQDHPVGIQVGTCIATLLRRPRHRSTSGVNFRHLWGSAKRTQLLEASVRQKQDGYGLVRPRLETGLAFSPQQSASCYFAWPLLTELFPWASPGIKTSRDQFLVDIDRQELERRLRKYFDPKVSDEEMTRLAPVIMRDATRFSAAQTRRVLLLRGLIASRIVRYCYRPFDDRWLYWEPETKLLDEKRSEAAPHSFPGNLWIAAVQQNRKPFDPPFVSPHFCSLHVIERGATLFPLYLHSKKSQPSLFEVSSRAPRTKQVNLSEAAASYLTRLRAPQEALFYHLIAVLHAPAYRHENASPLRQDWPRIPLTDSEQILSQSAGLGRGIATLLDTESALDGVVSGAVRPELRMIGSITSLGGGAVKPEKGDLDLTAGWGHSSKEGVTMPGQGRLVKRDHTSEELSALQVGAKELGLTLKQALGLWGSTTCDVYLNDAVYWKNVPVNVWGYVIGGYQVVKKWLSYRERDTLGRGLTLDEAREITNMCRRIAAILLLQPALDENYHAIKESCSDWSTVKGDSPTGRAMRRLGDE